MRRVCTNRWRYTDNGLVAYDVVEIQVPDELTLNEIIILSLPMHRILYGCVHSKEEVFDLKGRLLSRTYKIDLIRDNLTLVEFLAKGKNLI